MSKFRLSSRAAFRRLAVASVAIGAVAAHQAAAQVRTDGTVGTATTLTGPNYVIPQSLGLTNSSGTTVLQSFSQFDLTSGQTATFTGSNTLTAIIARITSGTASSIDGTIASTAANANLYFINPAGVVFGTNAVINVPAGFFVSTADRLNFTDGSALAMTATPVGTLSTAPIASFGFLGGGTGTITIHGANPGLTDFGVTNGDLDIVASDVAIDNRFLEAGGTGSQIRVDSIGALSGTIGLRGESSTFGGTITLTNMSNTAPIGTVGMPDVYISGGAMTLSRGSIPNGGGYIELNTLTDVNGNTSSLYFNGSSLTDNGGGLSTRYYTPLGMATPTAGNIGISLTGDLQLNNTAWALGASSAAPGVNVVINAANMSMVSSDFTTFTNTSLNAGSASIALSGALTMDTNSGLTSNVNTPSPKTAGNAGSIGITAQGGVSLTNGSYMSVASAVTQGTTGGLAGSISITAASLTMSNSDIDFNATGTRDAGGFSLTTMGNASFTGTSPGYSTLGGQAVSGTGGTLNLNVGGMLSMNDATFTVASSTGTGGGVRVTSGPFQMITNSEIVAAGLSGGSIDITAQDVSISAAGYISASGVGTTNSPGGTIDIDSTTDLAITGNSNVVATANAGAGGKINLTAGGQFDIDTSSIYVQETDNVTGTSALPGSGARAGTIAIDAGSLVDNNGRFGADAHSDGEVAGSIIIDTTGDASFTGTLAPINGVSAVGAVSPTAAGGSIDLSVGGNLTLTGTSIAATSGSGTTITSASPAAAGAIQIQAGTLNVANGTLAVDAADGGTAGSLSIVTTGDATFSTANLSATAIDGAAAGHIGVNIGGNLSFSNGSNVNSTSDYGLAGNVDLSAVGAISLTNSAINANVTASGTGSLPGDGGTITVNGASIMISASPLTAGTNALNGSGGSVTLTSTGTITVDNSAISVPAANGASTSGTGGTISIGGDDIVIQNGSDLYADQAAPEAPGDIVLDAQDSLIVNNGYISAASGWGATYPGPLNARGSISVTTGGDASFSNNAIFTGDSSSGNGSSITMKVGGSLTVDGSLIQSNSGWGNVTTTSLGSGGSINITAGSLSLDNGGEIFANGGDDGSNAGDIYITTMGDIDLNGTSALNTNITADTYTGTGIAGNLIVSAGGQLNLAYSYLESFSGVVGGGTGSPGHSGSVSVSAGSLLINQASIDADAYAGGTSAGILTVNIKNNATITGLGDPSNGSGLGSNSASGNGGSLVFKVGGVLTLDGAYIHTDSGYDPSLGPYTSGAAGPLQIAAGSIVSTNSGINAAGNNGWTGGNIAIQTTGNSSFSGSYGTFPALWSGSSAGMGGNFTLSSGGNLTLASTQINLAGTTHGGAAVITAGGTFSDQGSQITSPGGDIVVSASEIELLANGSTLLTVANPGQSGGQILLQAPTINIGMDQATNGQTATLAEDAGDNITVLAGTLNLGPDSTITAYAPSGDSGSIGLYANTFNVLPGAVVSTSAPVGRAGTITIGATNLTMTGGTISTQGMSGGSIVVGADNAMMLSGGAISSQVGSASSGPLAGDIFIGQAVGNPAIAAGACTGTCASFDAFNTSWVPGSHYGLPRTHQQTAVVAANGSTGQVLYGWDTMSPPENLSLFPPEPLVAQAISSSADPSNPDNAETSGISFIRGSSHSAPTVCAVAAAQKAGVNTFEDVVTRVLSEAPGRLKPQLYFTDPDPHAVASATCQDTVLLPAHLSLSQDAQAGG